MRCHSNQAIEFASIVDAIGELVLVESGRDGPDEVAHPAEAVDEQVVHPHASDPNADPCPQA